MRSDKFDSQRDRKVKPGFLLSLIFKNEKNSATNILKEEINIRNQHKIFCEKYKKKLIQKKIHPKISSFHYPV